MRKRLRAKHLTKHRKRIADNDLIQFHSDLAEQARKERNADRKGRRKQDGTK